MAQQLTPPLPVASGGRSNNEEAPRATQHLMACHKRGKWATNDYRTPDIPLLSSLSDPRYA